LLQGGKASQNKLYLSEEKSFDCKLISVYWKKIEALKNIEEKNVIAIFTLVGVFQIFQNKLILNFLFLIQENNIARVFEFSTKRAFIQGYY
jgi:hypothetical protein